MGSNAILLQYQAHIVNLHATASQLRLGQAIAIAITSLAFGAILLLACLSIVRRTIPLPSALVPLPLAIYSMRVFMMRNSSLARTLRLATFYEKGTARIKGEWVGLGEKGEEFESNDHYYGRDLNLFGEGSLFELLCTCRTEVGRRRLAGYLLQSTSLQEASKRQEAVRELKDNAALREQINLLGKYQFHQTSWSTITEWLNSPVPDVSALFRVTTFVTSASLALLILLGWGHVLAWSALTSWIAGLVLVNGALGFFNRSRIQASLHAIRSVGMELEILRQGLELMQMQEFSSVLLTELVRAALIGDPPKSIQKLERLTKVFAQRDKEWFYLGSRLLLIGTQAFLAAEKWRADHGEAMHRWLAIWGEFEALVALANYAYEHPDHTFPSFSEVGTKFEAEGLGHPLLSPERCVRNRVALNQEIRFYLISGSNMAGKSTLLRTIGLNAVLAYAGAPVCAERMELSRFQVCASISPQDSLLSGKSRFFAEIDRLRLALAIPSEDGPVLFLVDEILGGTNSKDRRAAAEVILKQLILRGAIGVLSTHDLALTDLALMDNLRGENMYMGSRDDSDPLNFDYTLKPGVNRQSSALAIARLVGIPV